MTRTLRAHAPRSPLRIAAALCLIAATAAGAHAQPAPSSGWEASPGFYRRVKTFDFDERPLGNFGDTPMFWRKLEGDGLPRFSAGAFDENVGYGAAPSFCIRVRGGSVAYEYTHPDLVLYADSDYQLEGYVRAAGLELGAVVVACQLADAIGQVIPGTERVTPLLRSLDPDGRAEDEPWQRFEIPLAFLPSDVHTLRLQLWVLQDHVYNAPAEHEPDPIRLQEVDAQVWFDDIAIVRMPRLRLGCDPPGGVVPPDTSAALLLSLHNPTLAPLDADLTVHASDGTEVYVTAWTLEPQQSTEQRIAVPGLAPDLYVTRVRVSGFEETLLERRTRFVVLPALPFPATRDAAFGVTFEYAPSEAPDLLSLTAALGCGTARLTFFEQPGLTNPPLASLRELMRALRIAQIDTACGLPTDDEGGSEPADADTAFPLDAVAAALSGQVGTWQVGADGEKTDPGGAEARRVRRALERFTALPALAYPRSILDAEPGGDQIGTSDSDAHAVNYWIPAEIPARDIPWYLASLSEANPVPRLSNGDWLTLGRDDDLLTIEERAADMAQRIVLAAAIRPGRLLIHAPFEATRMQDGAAWQPTELYIPLHTLLRALAGTRATTAVRFPADVVGVVFTGESRSVAVLWTWQAAPVEVNAFVGADAEAIDLWGRSLNLAFDGARARVPVGPMPLIVSNVDAALLALQQSFSVEPAFIELHADGVRPMLRFDNPYPAEMTGTVTLSPPHEWQVAPATDRIELAEGGAFELPLAFVIPPRQVASERLLRVDLHLSHPRPADLFFEVPLEVGLKDIEVRTAAWWDGDVLVVEQTLYNHTGAPVSFSTFCQPPGAARHEGLMLDVPQGEKRAWYYRLAGLTVSPGTQLWLGIEEIRGRRSLDQLVAIPR